VVNRTWFFLAQRRSKVELEPDLDQPRIVAVATMRPKSPALPVIRPVLASMEVVGTELRLLIGVGKVNLIE